MSMQKETPDDRAKTSRPEITNGKKTTHAANQKEKTHIMIYITPCTDRRKCTSKFETEV